MPESGFGRPGPKSASLGKKEKLPSERVREKLDLEGIAEEEDEEEIDWVRGVSVGKKRGRDAERAGQAKKRKKELTPSQKVRRRLEGLGPREAWDPNSP